MKTEIIIANLSCGGCVTTISKKLSDISGVENVAVDLETNTVSVDHKETVHREQLTQMLFSIGYPEATEQNGLLLKLKSLSSCLTGKIANITE
jgi:copper chaperone CopZ